MRLNKYLASCGVCSRREADALIAAGRVKINGLTAQTGAAVHPEAEQGGDVITLNGHRIEPQKKVMIALYKPVGVVSGTSRNDRAVPVTDLVKVSAGRGAESTAAGPADHGAEDPEGLRLFPVGRLDKDSEGLMLLTNMGDLSERIAKAGTRHEKEYEVTVAKPATDGFLARLAKGVYITLDSRKDINGKFTESGSRSRRAGIGAGNGNRAENGAAGGKSRAGSADGDGTYRYLTRPAKVKRLSDSSFSIIITEGKNRQIRKMCEELGNRVTKLKRIRIVNIGLGDLAPGTWRRLSGEEIEELEKTL